MSLRQGVAIALMALLPSVGNAVELVAGGALTAMDGDSAGSRPAWDMRALDGSATAPAFSLGFTPRAGTGFQLGGDSTQERPVTLSLGVSGGSPAGGLGQYLNGPALHGPTDTASPFSVGGVLAWSDWSLGGSVGRSSLFGLDTGIMGGSLGYGGLTARFSYGESEGARASGVRDVWLFGTDLEMRSWLTLEGDFAVSTQESVAEPMTMGRLGVKLRF